MTRRRNKQASGRREQTAPQHRPCKNCMPADTPEQDANDMGKAAQVLPSSNQFVQTCCLLCHRERKDLVGSLPHNGLLSPVGEIPASFMPSLAQNLLGEMPLWICQSCRKSVEEEERRVMPEQPLAVSLSHTSCKSQSCGGGSHSSSSSSSSTSCSSPSSSSCHGNSADWDPSSFLSAHKLSGLWNSTNANSNTGGSADSTGIHPTSRNLCKSSNQVKSHCQSHGSTEGCHSSEHHKHCDPLAPPNSPTGISSQQNPPLSPTNSTTCSPNLSSHPISSDTTAISPSKAHRGPHIFSSSPTLLNVNPPPLSSCSHSCNGNCNGGNVLPTGCTTGNIINRDAACKGHHKHSTIPCEDDDEDSSSERSSCTSSSTNQKDGKFCDCCYCEFFGQNAGFTVSIPTGPDSPNKVQQPPPAPTSRNYPEMREKLRIRLTKRKEEHPQKSLTPGEQTVDNRDVNDLLDFINSTDTKTTTSSKAAKRARNKLKKNLSKAGNMQSTQKSFLQEEIIQKASIEDICVSASDEALLQWPPLELEQVNSFLTSRLEEIKNTIKDSIRASFSVYDLNLDVNDFPKKAAMLEQKNLLSHLNGSSDLAEIDLDLSPLSLGGPKTLNAKTSEDSEKNATQVAENGVVKRLSAVPNLSRMIWVQSPKVTGSKQSSGLKKSGNLTETKNLNLSEWQDIQVPPPAAPPTAPEAVSTVPPVAVSQPKKPRKQSVQVQKDGSIRGDTIIAKLPSARSKTQTQKLRHLPGKGEAQSQHGSNAVIACSRKSEERNRQDRNQRTGGNTGTPTGKVLCESPQPRKKGKKNKDNLNPSFEDIFLPKDTDSMEMDEADREVEYFKRFCLDSAKQTRQKVVVNWTNFSLKKPTSSVAQ